MNESLIRRLNGSLSVWVNKRIKKLPPRTRIVVLRVLIMVLWVLIFVLNVLSIRIIDLLSGDPRISSEFRSAATYIFVGIGAGTTFIALVKTLDFYKSTIKKNRSGFEDLAARAPSLRGISNFADFWGLGLRKKIKAGAGEFDVEVKRLHKEKRYRMAKWNVVLAWSYAVWYVLRGPYDLVKDALVKAIKGL